MRKEVNPPVKDALLVDGKIEEIKGRSFFTVRLFNGKMVLARVAARSRRIKKHLYPGVGVRIELTPYDLSKGRIVELIRWT